MIAGVILIVQQHRDIIRFNHPHTSKFSTLNELFVRSQTEWNLVFALVRSTISQPDAARLSFDLIAGLCRDGPEQLVTVDNFPGLVTLLDDFATTAGTVTEGQQQHARRSQALTSSKYVGSRYNRSFCLQSSSSPTIDRGRKAVDLLFDLKKFLSSFLELQRVQGRIIYFVILVCINDPLSAWRQMCLPLLMSLGRQSSNASREVRHAAISQLQRILLGSYITFNDGHAQVEEIFNRVIFPLLDELLKPQVFQRDPQGMSETRLRASALLCKAFMHFEVRESSANADIRILWIQILDLLDRLMNINKGDQLVRTRPISTCSRKLIVCTA